MTSPLLHPGWIAFNEDRWQLKAVKINSSTPEPSGGSAGLLVYANSRGHIRQPKRTPYAPITVQTNHKSRPSSITRQWLDWSESLATQMQQYGTAGVIPLDPAISDIRAWQWAGYRAEVRYTYLLNVPFNLELAGRSTRKLIRKADSQGFVVERTEDFEAVFQCLSETEDRQGFDYHVSLADIDRLSRLMGKEHCRAYICRSPEGEPVCSRIALHAPGGMAIGWVAGNRQAFLGSGATQLLAKFTLDDLHTANSAGFDFGGANLKSVANYKAGYGGKLTPYYALRAPSIRTLAQDTLSYFRGFARKQG